MIALKLEQDVQMTRLFVKQFSLALCHCPSSRCS